MTRSLAETIPRLTEESSPSGQGFVSINGGLDWAKVTMYLGDGYAPGVNAYKRPRIAVSTTGAMASDAKVLIGSLEYGPAPITNEYL